MSESSPSLPVKHNPYLHDLIWTMLCRKKAGVLLDIPSGPGYFAQQAQSAGFKSIAAEIDESLHVLDEVDYRKIDMSQPLPFGKESLDYIVSIEGIEHIENQFLFLRECANALRKGGLLYITTPNASSLVNRFTFLLTGVHEHPAVPIRSDTQNLYFEHINLIPFYRLETFLRFSGFRINVLTTYRLRKGSLALYPLIKPIAGMKMRNQFRKHFAGKTDSHYYSSIIKMYTSQAVLCGSHIVIEAEKI